MSVEPLYETTSAYNIRKVLVRFLQNHSIAIITNNVLNDVDVSEYAHEYCENYIKGHYIPCRTHVIQLGFRDLLSLVKANPANNEEIETWTDDMALLLHRFYCVRAVLQRV